MRGYVLAGLFLLVVSVSFAQDFESCYPKEIQAEQSVQAEEDEQISLDTESVTNYFDICVPISGSSEPTVRALVRATSEICTEFPIHEGDNCHLETSVRYGFDPELGRCVEFKYTGCGGNENNFGTEQECLSICMDTCMLPMDEGFSSTVSRGKDGKETKVDCSDRAGTYYYYNHEEGKCLPMEYQGCGGNKNRFEYIEDCAEVCVSGDNNKNDSIPENSLNKTEPIEPTQPLDLELSRGKRFALADPNAPVTGAVAVAEGENCDQNNDDNNNGPEFCNQFRRKYPEAAQIIDTIDRTTSGDVDNQLVKELESQIKSNTTDSTASRTKQLLITIFTRPLKHTTVKIYSKDACRRIDITIRIFCVKGITHRPTDDQKDHLCELVKQGIKRHWEVDLLNPDNTVNYPVTVTVKESLLLSKKVVLQWYDSVPNNPNFLRSWNLGIPWFPMWMKYKGFSQGAAQDESFAATAAHEFGHDVLKASGGIVWSWGHEGTSTIFGNTIPGVTPPSPANPAPINLMWYYSGGDNSNYYNRLRATQYQVNDLIKYATWRFHIWWCPGSIGAPCFSDKHCNHPGICRWFRCVYCSHDSHCSSTEYCRGIFNPFMINHCTPRKPNGALCSRDTMCLSGMCDGGQCVECEQDSHCPSGHYCKNNNLPFILNKCEAKKPNGAFCLQDRVCQSGMCDGGQCVECEQDHHCPSGQYCKNKNIPLALNQCTSLLGFGAWCVSDSQCASGYCNGLRCGECETHSNCNSDEWCSFIPPKQCKNKKCQGFCINDVQCLSGTCRWYGLCKRC